jgi:hypothetical protein
MVYVVLCLHSPIRLYNEHLLIEKGKTMMKRISSVIAVFVLGVGMGVSDAKPASNIHHTVQVVNFTRCHCTLSSSGQSVSCGKEAATNQAILDVVYNSTPAKYTTYTGNEFLMLTQTIDDPDHAGSKVQGLDLALPGSVNHDTTSPIDSGSGAVAVIDLLWDGFHSAPTVPLAYVHIDSNNVCHVQVPSSYFR